MKKLQIAESFSADLRECTWTFQMNESVTLKAGYFAIIDISKASVNQKIELEKAVSKIFN